MSRPRRFALAGALLALASCARDPSPLGPHDAFVPVVLRSGLPGRIPWVTRVTLAGAGGAPARVRLYRWPPDARPHEIEELDLPSGGPLEVPLRIPEFPAVSSFLFESASPFTVTATISAADGSRPSLSVPILRSQDLAREGDRLLVGPFVSSEAERSHLTFTFPWTEHDAVPFRVRSVATSLDGQELSRREHAIHGVPQVVENPWSMLSIPPGVPFNLEVTLLGSTRGHRSRKGLWVYGIVQEKATGISRFLTTTVIRKPSAS